MAAQMKIELDALIAQVERMDGGYVQETRLLANAFAGLKERAEYYMNHRVSPNSIHMFAAIANDANYWYDTLS